MGERVDAECGLLDEEDSEDASVDEAAQEVIPNKAAEDGGEEEAHEEDDLEVMTVLPNDDWVFIQVTDINAACTLWVLLHDHPSEVRVEETLADGVGIFVGAGFLLAIIRRCVVEGHSLCVSMMGSVVPCPPSHTALDGTASCESQEDPQWEGSGVAGVGP